MERYNLAVEYLEAHLGDGVDAAALARIAHTSEHHFRRLFSSLAGMGLAEYVRRRRMTIAAAAIVEGDETVLAIAQRLGYESADAFARAFRGVHGVAPDAARTPGTRLASQQRLSFHLTTTGRDPMTYRIEQTPALRIVGRRARLPLVHRGPNPAIQAFVAAIPVEETIALKSRNDVAPHGVLALCADVGDDRAEGSEFTYLHGVATLGATPEGADVIDVPASTWAVFTPADPSDEALQDLWPHVFVEWLPANEWRLALDLEIVAMRVAEDGSLERELWVPVARDV
jgi:AraC family transcriptional regulator